MTAEDFQDKLLMASTAVKDAVDQCIVPVCRKNDLTLQQFHVLAALETCGPQNVGELSRQIGILRGNITGVCKKMEQRELVIRSRNPEDERIVMVEISSQGHELFTAMTKELSRCWSEMIEKEPSETVEEIIKGLEKLSDLMQRVRKD